MHFLILMRWNGGKNVTEIEKKKKRDKIKFTTISVISLCVFFGVWYVATAVMHLMPDYSLPSPVQVVEAFFYKLGNKAPDGGTLFQHIAASLKVALTGYLLGAVIGIPLGICMAWFRRIDLFVTPLFDLVRPVPTIAWIPLMILWFGIGLGAKAAIIFVSAFIPCVINSYAGIKQTRPVHLWVAQTFGASRTKMLFTVAIPTAMPLIFTGLRISLQAAWTTLCAAEMLAANKGLGYMIQLNRSLARADLIIVGMLTIGLIGTIFSVVLGKMEKKMVRGGSKS
ncbi:MAG TPA: ABC transporter permease [Candidatus Lachnoclostridium stercoripullorum]|uniref:ABC transporter permease n=1 Tax=Candidatus Lachnoclostridium stercoripullorum TaxID=2838635 RepID=A0A9D1W3X1_9FIRM|nr:ABC transporter permease [Candidatus Lachnoclostridium stercoripullorum]